ncbi:MAG TPA: hypothetical protein VNT23_10285 [Gaiellaceae bacterium]|nr:hypothetical protein [Gaiellaceae bacterium]
MDAPKAVHLTGGNRFDQIRLDIPASFAVQDEWLSHVDKIDVRRAALVGARRAVWHRVSRRARLREVLVTTGLERMWFDEFEDYWLHVLDGRPISINDFHQLRFVYRTRAQHSQQLDWSTPEQHLANWQAPENISATFAFVHRAAIEPMRDRALLNRLSSKMRVLEYGCSIAPLYRMWRHFASHRDVEWVLADIPNYPFHYARHVYGRDRSASFCTVVPGASDSVPAERFDLIAVQEVFEHLDRPL